MYNYSKKSIANEEREAGERGTEAEGMTKQGGEARSKNFYKNSSTLDFNCV